MEDNIRLPEAPPVTDTLTEVFSSPGEMFQKVKNTAPAPKLWVIPLITSLLIGIVFSVVLFTNETLKMELRETQSKAMQKLVDEGKMTQEQADQAESRMESMGTMFLIIAIITIIVFLAVYYFGGALFIWLADKTILKSTAGYGKHLELYGISSWIGVLGSIITIIMVIGLGTMKATPSAALAVLSSYDPMSTLHKYLSALNVFSIWQTLVIGIGMSRFSDKPAGKSIAVAVILWIIWVLVSVNLGLSR
jgi:magnesium-transporting ATPase (P-type)